MGQTDIYLQIVGGGIALGYDSVEGITVTGFVQGSAGIAAARAWSLNFNLSLTDPVTWEGGTNYAGLGTPPVSPVQFTRMINLANGDQYSNIGVGIPDVFEVGLAREWAPSSDPTNTEDFWNTKIDEIEGNSTIPSEVREEILTDLRMAREIPQYREGIIEKYGLGPAKVVVPSWPPISMMSTGTLVRHLSVTETLFIDYPADWLNGVSTIQFNVGVLDNDKVEQSGSRNGESRRIDGPQVDKDDVRPPSNLKKPILLDLDGDGIEITELDRSTTFMDASGSGLKHRTAWAGKGDGVLFWDGDADGAINDDREYILTEWDPTAGDDLAALRSRFDTNGDGKLSGAELAGFKVMVTYDDGSQTAQTLAALGITEIRLTPDTTRIRMADGSAITGQASFVQGGVTKTLANVTLTTT